MQVDENEEEEEIVIDAAGNDLSETANTGTRCLPNELKCLQWCDNRKP